MRISNSEYTDGEIPGWMSMEELKWLFLQSTHYRTIVEIGSAYGRSSNAILSGNNYTFGGSGTVYCVDPWYGKDEDKSFSDSCERALDRRKVFWENNSKFPNLRILELPSLMAYGALKDEPIDMVFLDGGTDNIEEHIRTWLGYNFPRKLICGHDFSDKYPNVQRAVSDLFGSVLELVPGTSIWFVRMVWKEVS